MEKKIGLVLSGGGAKGAAHIGVIKALEEYQLPIDSLAGTSAGALAATFMADGKSADDMLQFFTDSDLFSFHNWSFGKPGLLDTEKFVKMFEEHIVAKNFEDLPIKLNIVATDLINAKSVTINEGPIIPALLSSCAFPLVFSPIPMRDSLYCDGGVINNFPVETLDNDQILGVYVSPLKNIQPSELNNTLNVLDRVYRISNRYSSLEKFSQCTWIINPPELQNYGTFATNKVEEIYEIGYRYASELLPKIVQELDGGR